jgi:two-component system, NarL family, nitrate/nitrite response regulator NarL
LSAKAPFGCFVRVVGGSANLRLTTQSLNENPAPPSIARVIIVDDNDSVRESLRSMLECEPSLQIVDEAKDGQEAIELCRLHRPDLVLMDVRMPRVDGFEATRRIKEEMDTTKVLMMSASNGREYVSRAIRAGAEGYVSKDASIEEWQEAVREVLSGEFRYP